jgi:hypothetical protein
VEQGSGGHTETVQVHVGFVVSVRVEATKGAKVDVAVFVEKVIQAFGEGPSLVENTTLAATQEFGTDERQQYMAKLDVGGERMVSGVLTEGLVKLYLDRGGERLFERFALPTGESSRRFVDGRVLGRRRREDVGVDEVCLVRVKDGCRKLGAI